MTPNSLLKLSVAGIAIATFQLNAFGESFGPRTIADAWLGGTSAPSYQQSAAGTTVSATTSSPVASGTVESSLGLIRVTAQATGPDGAAYLSGYGMDTHTITGGTGEGTVTFTYQITGTIETSTAAGSSAQYDSGTNHWSALVHGTKGHEGSRGMFPPQIITDTFTFTYGEPFDMEGNLRVNLFQPNAGQSGSASLVMQPCGYVVSGGTSYTGTATGGTTKGARFERGAAYGGFTLGNIRFRQTIVTLLDGTANGTRDVALNFLAPRSDLNAFSDIVHLQGTSNDPFVIQLNYDEAAAMAHSGTEDIMLARIDEIQQNWKNAVTGNTGGSPSAKEGPYNPATDFVPGKFGIDRTANVVWAVVNHQGWFAATQAVLISPPPNDYPSWKSTFFNESAAANPAISGPHADPDQDGLTNQLEFGFNLSPILPGNPILIAGSGTAGLPVIMPVATNGGNVLRLEYIRRKASTNPGINYTPQSSSTPGTGWDITTGTETVTPIDSIWERVVIEETTSQPGKFSRVKVSPL